MILNDGGGGGGELRWWTAHCLERVAEAKRAGLEMLREARGRGDDDLRECREDLRDGRGSEVVRAGGG